MRNNRIFIFLALLFASFLASARSYAATPKVALYVTNRSDNTVSVIDAATNAVTATVPVGATPFLLKATPDGKHVYVTNSDSSNVSVIDTATNNVVTTIPVGANPAGIVITPDGTKAYVANVNANTVSVIDIASNTVTATIPVSGKAPIGAAVTPDGKHVYVGNIVSATISVIDTTTNTETATISLAGITNPFAAAVTPDGTKVYVAGGGSGTVSVITTATNTVATTITGFSTVDDVTISPDGTKAYATDNSANNVYVINTTSNVATSTIQVGSSPFGVALTPDGVTAYVANQNSNDVSVINTATNSVTTSVTVGNTPTGVAVAKLPPPPPVQHTLRLYLHGNDAPMTAGGFTMNQTPGNPSPLWIGVQDSKSWFSDPTLTGTFASSATYTLHLPCTQGFAIGTTFTLDVTDANGNLVQSLGSTYQAVTQCHAPFTVSIPVSGSINVTNQRLKLTITNLLGVVMTQKTDVGAYLESTKFTGTP